MLRLENLVFLLFIFSGDQVVMTNLMGLTMTDPPEFGDEDKTAELEC